MASTRGFSKNTADLIYDAFYSGAIGGSVVALFFLVVDVLGGRPLFTPSLMGSVLFGGADAASVTDVRLDMVGYYSIVHFAVFGAVGAVVALVVHQVEIRSRHPAEILGVLFVVFEGGFLISATLFMPGVLQQLGAFRVVVANLLAASAIGLFLLAEHNPEAWQRIKQQAHL